MPYTVSPGKRSARCSLINSGMTTLDAAFTAGAGAGASTEEATGFASGDASGDAVSAAALKPANANERATIDVNNFFIALLIKGCTLSIIFSVCVFLSI